MQSAKQAQRMVVKEDNRKRLVFLTNNFALKPELIGDLYRQRWQVELFFKWIKQHLRIKVFFGTSENAVKTQIWIAISTYLLITIAKSLPRKVASIVKEWCLVHQSELQDNWQRAQRFEPLDRIQGADRD